ncbi:MAG: allantoinase AllB [Dethiosulfovibrio sp.]|nr:allantoinase AllB [Dethiosulfovibrio sp.]
MEYDLILKGGTIVLDWGEVEADVAVRDGKIVSIGSDLGRGKEEIDASGLIVTPGMVDPHVHISEPGRTEWEGYITGTSAAAKGGVTSFVMMPLNQLPCTADRESLDLQLRTGEGRTKVDIALYGALTPNNLDSLEDLSYGGVVGYKAFLSSCGDRTKGDDMMNVDDYSLYRGMKTISCLGKVLALHCENAAITDGLGTEARQEGPDTLASYVASRPIFTEVEAVRRALYLAKQTGVRLHICHCSCPEAVSEVSESRFSGLDVTAETCTHYLYFTTDELDDIGNSVKCSPPIRDGKNLEGMWEKLFKGEIACVGSDHSPCTADLKEGTAFSAWGGIAGLQNSYDVLFDEAVQKRGMSLSQFVRITATNAAEIFGLKGKGRIAIGHDADFALIRPNAPYRVTEECLEYKNKLSPYIGRTVGCQIVRTIVRGRTVFSQESGVSKDFAGRFLLSK